MNKDMFTIAVANHKGGVGKTTISFNLAHIFASKKGVSLLAIDNDSQAHLTSSFLSDKSTLSANVADAYEKKPIIPHEIKKNLHLIGADERLTHVIDGDIDTIYLLKDALSQFKNSNPEKQYDYAIIDCLPASSFVQMAALTAADFVLIPVKPAPYALKGMVDFIKTVEKVKRRLNNSLKILGIIINQVDGRRPNLERDMEEALRDNYGNLVLKSKINKRVNIEASPAFQQSITEYDPKSPSAKEFKALSREIIKRIKEAKNG